MQTPTKATAHSVYNLNYPLLPESAAELKSPVGDFIVFVTKYRNQVLTGAVEKHIKEQMPILCERYGWAQLALECMPDHVHLFVSAPPTTASVTITQTLKSILALSVFKTFPALKQQRFWGSGLWSDGCYYGSAETVSAATIAKYIANQKTKPE